MSAFRKPRLEAADDYDRYDDADISTAPFVDLPAYGRKLWQRPIKFVPAAAESAPLPAPAKPEGLSFSQRYLALFYPNGPPPPEPPKFPKCDVCGHLIHEASEKEHHLSIAHQLALPRPPAPSSIDRTRMGLKVMEKHGFDIDARVGLGAHGQGMLFPIVPKEKRDKLGLGVEKEEVKPKKKAASVPKSATLDAGKVRKLAAEQKKKDKKYHNLFYGNDDLDKYLGGKGPVDHGLK